MAENVAITPSRRSQDTYADDGEHFVSDCIQRCVVPAGQASSTVVNIELRQAWDGAWYPLIAQEGEPSFTNHYGDSAQDYWENAASRTRKAIIISMSPGTTERTSQQSNSAATIAVAQVAR